MDYSPDYVAYCLDCDKQLNTEEAKTHDCHNEMRTKWTV